MYSMRVPDAVKSLKDAGSSIPVASVAAGFPAGRCASGRGEGEGVCKGEEVF